MAQHSPSPTVNLPSTLQPKFNQIPEMLKAIPNWVCWKLEYRDKKWTKIPKQQNRRNANPTDSSTWGNFSDIQTAYLAGTNFFSGIGFVLDGKPITVNGNEVFLAGLDFDHCVNGDDIDPFANEIIEKLDTYVEYSPSGKGVRLFVLVDKLIPSRKVTLNSKSREFYSNGRYLTVTGRGGGEIKLIPNFEAILEKYFPLPVNSIPNPKSLQSHANAVAEIWQPKLLGQIFKSELEPDLYQMYEEFVQQGEFIDVLPSDHILKRRRLVAGDNSDYGGDASSGDMALATSLLNNGFTKDQTERVMRFTRYRPKFDAKRGEHTYLAMTINKVALNGVSQQIALPIQLNSPVLQQPANDPLRQIQNQYSLISLGGTIGVVDMIGLRQRQRTCAYESLVVLKKDAGTLLATRLIKSKFADADAKKIVAQFFVDPVTTLYNGIDFRPGKGHNGALNLWVGPTLQAARGKWPVLHDFLLNVICAGDDRIYQYLLNYLAQALQHPEIKPGVMLTLIAGQGTGKGTFFAIIKKIWGATTLQTSRIDDVCGAFNSSLEGCMWVLLDEACFARDLKLADNIKSLATEPEIRINAKNQPQRTIPSSHRIVSATNHMHAAHREHDDRRDLTLRVSESKKGDFPYWKVVHAAIETEAPALMAHLQTLDLTNFDVKIKPDTSELTKQKIHSLPTAEAYWHDCLYNGHIGYSESWPAFISTKSLIDGIKDFNKGARAHAPITSNMVADMIKRVCPTAQSTQQTDGSFRRRGYQLPTLEEARKAFEGHIKGKIEW